MVNLKLGCMKMYKEYRCIICLSLYRITCLNGLHLSITWEATLRIAVISQSLRLGNENQDACKFLGIGSYLKTSNVICHLYIPPCLVIIEFPPCLVIIEF